jgi:hypothetical protein
LAPLFLPGHRFYAVFLIANLREAFRACLWMLVDQHQ